MSSTRRRSGMQRLLRAPWARFVAELERHARREARAAMRGWERRKARAGPRSVPSRAVCREMLRDRRRTLDRLASASAQQRLRGLAEVFDLDAGPWGGAGLQRRLWARRWGLEGVRAGDTGQGSVVQRMACEWMAESYARWLAPASLPWYERAAALGSALAARRRAWAYDERIQAGKARRGDEAQAVRWYKRAVELGDTTSANEVGVACFYGRGVRRDRAAARRWYEIAARGPGARSRDEATRLDTATAMTNLGRMYRKGAGVQQSWRQALRWFKKATWLGSPQAAHQLARYYSGKDGPRAQPRRQLAALELAAVLGCADCRRSLGVLLWNGQRVPRDRARALVLYAQAAEAGDAWGMHLLGRAYREIDPPRRDLEASRLWLRRAARRGVEEAARLLRERPAAKGTART